MRRRLTVDQYAGLLAALAENTLRLCLCELKSTALFAAANVIGTKMPIEGESNPKPSLTSKFFDEIRRVNLGEKDEIDFSVEELATIAADVSLLTEFCSEFKRFSQDPDAKLLVIEIVRKLATAQEGTVERCVSSIETIDRYPARLSGGAAIGGTGALLYGAVATGAIPILGPAILVVGGVVGLSACIYGRWRLSRDRSTASIRQKHFEQLVSRLEKVAR